MLRALARIDRAAIEHNCRVLQRAAPGSAFCPVVKADGYGHGASVAAWAAIATGSAWVAVATAAEARALREQDIRTRILVLGALSPEELDIALAADADVVGWSDAFVRGVAARGGGSVHVKLDTGMGRLGTRDPAEATALLEAIDADPVLRAGGLMTHFATADDRDDPFLDEQRERFEAWALPLRRPDLLVHAANSAATLRDARTHFDLVRCGVAIYGLDPFGDDPAAHDLRPALTLSSDVAAVKRCAAGESAGYGRRFVAERDTMLATVPIGYADGVRRGLTNNAEVLVRGRRVPLVGTVSMDNVTLDLGPATDVQAGDEVVLLGAQDDERVLAEEWARRLDTINYEVTCAISARVPRTTDLTGGVVPALLEGRGPSGAG